MKKIMKTLLVIVLIAAILLSGYNLYKISAQYTGEARTKEKMLRYRPESPASQNKSADNNVNNNAAPAGAPNAPNAQGTQGTQSAQGADPGEDTETEVNNPAPPVIIVNQSVIDMQSDVNSDIVGWLTIPDTRIDYPFVKAADNDYYLRRNVYRAQAAAGSLFMDSRCAEDFSDFNAIIYGHNMKNNSMFGEIKFFSERGFFDAHKSGTLYIKNNTFVLRVFAYMVVRANDGIIYNPAADRDEFYSYVKENARQYQEPSTWGNVVTLSTCAYEYEGARMVLIAEIIPNS